MRVARLTSDMGYYHVVSRLMDNRTIDEDDRANLRGHLKACVAFSGVTLLTYAIMNDHFHALVYVPDPASVSDSELLDRLLQIYSTEQVTPIREALSDAASANDQDAREAIRMRYLKRMFDVSSLFKTVKQRTTQAFNRKHGRRGPLWESRFKSLLVEPTLAEAKSERTALLIMAAYIDLNAVRANATDAVEAYPFCGYAEACAGSAEARAGIASLFADGSTASWKQINRRYRTQMFLPVRVGDPVYTRADATKALSSGDPLPLALALRCRIRHLSDGVVFGSKDFVENAFQQNREQFGVKRKTGARRIAMIKNEDLYVMRDLRLNPITA